MAVAALKHGSVAIPLALDTVRWLDVSSLATYAARE
jgi:hypothetical protein